ncbi:hypothetical protein I5I84_00530 [Pseudomonas aeruginosa]|nr:hypothetical protein [Pseudomonas aeruginosa]
MKEIRFTNWRDFQDLCRFWMQHLVQQRMQRSSTYYVYGNDGEGQGGVDLVPEDATLGVVGQSKCWNSRVLSWAKIDEELQKTHSFPGAIRVYVILTTAPRHTSVQQNMPGDECRYQRPQGEFLVRIYYWDELPNLHFIPRQELQRVFPRLFPTPPPPSEVPSLTDYSRSLQSAREFLPNLITQQHLNWLATWNFSVGYVPAAYFDLFYDLNIEVDRTQHAITSEGLRHWLNEGNRLRLSQCLPAAASLFKAIQDFAQAVSSETVSVRLPDGNAGYGHCHYHAGAAARITHSWKTHAEALLATYQNIVAGTSPNY